jgi:hypothetical protein
MYMHTYIYVHLHMRTWMCVHILVPWMIWVQRGNMWLVINDDPISFWDGYVYH